MKRAMLVAVFVSFVAFPFVATAAEAQKPQSQTAARDKPIEELPGLYKITGHGGDVCDVYLILTPEPVLIDCGSRAAWERLVASLKVLGLSPGDVRWVIGTHGHWDHVDAMGRFQREYPAVKFAIHAGDAQYVINNDRVFNCAETVYKSIPSDPLKVDRVLFDGDRLDVGKSTFRIIHTPGHTPGSITIVTTIDGKKVAFCGDSVTGWYSLANRSSTLDWQISMRKLLQIDLDRLYIGHGGRPFVGPEAIRKRLQVALQAATDKREQQAGDEVYRTLYPVVKKGG